MRWSRAQRTLTGAAQLWPDKGVTDFTSTRVAPQHPIGTTPDFRPTTLSGVYGAIGGLKTYTLPAASLMTGPQNSSTYAQPMNVVVPVGFRLAASTCVVMPIAAETTAVIIIILGIVMVPPPLLSPAFGGLTNKTGWIDVVQPKIYTGR